MKESVDVSALNSRIKFDRLDVAFDQRAILGDATETGLARFAARYLPSEYDDYMKLYPKTFESGCQESRPNESS
jgi:sodium/potassium-transporting ATPase subunit alpha